MAISILYSMLMLLAIDVVILLLVATTSGVQGMNFQPKVTTLEAFPSRRSAGIVALPGGSLWCKGAPTVWLPGHHNHLSDIPNCRREDGQWDNNTKAIMDIQDDLNALDTKFVIDRHDCGAIDANMDGLMDIYCTVGADKGRGEGYNELYLTRKDGSLFKIRRHGLQGFNTMRTRHTTVIKGDQGREFVFITANHGARDDGRPNEHRMFLKTGAWHDDPSRRFFISVPGPWIQHSITGCAIAADLNNDGLEDLVVCNQGSTEGFIFTQTTNGRFRKNIPLAHKSQTNWRNARVADFNNDGFLDLAVVYGGDRDSRLSVFLGNGTRPFFNFEEPYYTRSLPFAAPDLEVIDTNADGIVDIYIVQSDERMFNEPGRVPRNGTYCGGPRFFPEQWWTGGPNRITPPNGFAPPPDMAPDLLLIGMPNQPKRFREIIMNHGEPGCGYRVKKFGERSLVLAQGHFDRPGHQLFLEWGTDEER